jgi:hypothetical protein
MHGLLAAVIKFQIATKARILGDALARLGLGFDAILELAAIERQKPND